MGDFNEEVVRPPYIVTLTDRRSFLCFSGQRGTIAKSMYEEHLCIKTDYELLGRRGNDQLIISLQALRAAKKCWG